MDGAGAAGSAETARDDGRARIRVVVADDHPLYRAAVAATLGDHPDLEVVAQAGDGEEALRLIRDLRPDVAVLDQRMPLMEGTRVLSLLADEGLPTRVLLLSAQAESDVVVAALGAGACGYLAKDADPETIIGAVLTVAGGGTVLSPAAQAGIAGAMRVQAAAARVALTPREAEILSLVAEGLSAPAMGRRLHLSASTVKTHLVHLYEKLGVSDRAAAVAEAMRRGLIG